MSDFKKLISNLSNMSPQLRGDMVKIITKTSYYGRLDSSSTIGNISIDTDELQSIDFNINKDFRLTKCPRIGGHDSSSEWVQLNAGRKMKDE